MLGMISNMALVKYKSQPLNPLMVAASLLRLVFGNTEHENHVRKCLSIRGHMQIF